MNHIQIRPTRFLIASLALLAAAGCADTSGPGAPEDRGVLLATVDGGFSRHLAWSSDGTQLVFATSTALSAISISTHAVRQLDASPSITILDLRSAGERIYFAAAVATSGPSDPNFRVSRVNPTGGAVEILLTKIWSGGEYVLVSDDERFLVANQVLYDIQAATQIALPPGRPIGFSPDGTQLLYYQYLAGSSTDSPTLISTADGSSSQALHSTSSFYSGHRWEGNSPQLIDFSLNNGTLRLFEVDGVTGATRDLAQFGANPSFPTILPLANWSPDNRTLGVWVEQGSGQSRTTNLYVIRSGSAATVVANLTTSLNVGVGLPEFSRSGNSVAYNYYNDGARSLYMKSGI
jgi:hypothetical protein